MTQNFSVVIKYLYEPFFDGARMEAATIASNSVHRMPMSGLVQIFLFTKENYQVNIKEWTNSK